MNLGRDALKGVVIPVTIVCLLSMGGAMRYAVWFLVPLHWILSRGSGPYATGGWALLAALSVAEAAWMLTWIATDHDGFSAFIALVGLVGTIVVFLQAASARLVAR